MKIVLYDIETTSIDNTNPKIVSHIHCIGLMEIIDGVAQPPVCYTSFPLSNSDGNLPQAIQILKEADLVVGFNSRNFDDNVIKAHYGFDPKSLDLIIIAKLCYSRDELFSIDYGVKDMPTSYYGSFSLGAFGHRLGTYKGDYNDWSKLSTEMIEYCKGDIEVTYDLYQHLINHPLYPNEYILKLEHDVASIISEQERNRVYVDTDKARNLAKELVGEKFALNVKLQNQYKPKFLPDGKVQTTNKLIKRRRYLPSGDYSSPHIFHPVRTYKMPLRKFKNRKIKPVSKTKYKWFTEPHRIIITEKEGEFQNIKYTRFNPGSRDHVRKWMKDVHNFEFNSFTEKGTPKVDEDGLKQLGDVGSTIQRYFKVVKDLSQISQGDGSILGNLDEKTSTVSTRIDTNGTVTGRFTSSSINLSQVPSQKEFREIFSSPTYYHLDDNLYTKLKNF